MGLQREAGEGEVQVWTFPGLHQREVHQDPGEVGGQSGTSKDFRGQHQHSAAPRQESSPGVEVRDGLQQEDPEGEG